MTPIKVNNIKFHLIRKGIRARYSFLNSRFTIFEELKDRLIFVDPQKINLMFVTSNFDYPTRELSGAVVNDNFFSDSLIPLRLHPKIRYCTAHWGSGNSWEESGVIDYYQQMFKRFNSSGVGFDKLRNFNDVYHRLSILDDIYSESKNN